MDLGVPLDAGDDLAGIAIEIVVRQVPTILGVPGGGSTTIERLRQVAGQLSHTYGWTLGIALGVLAVIAAATSHGDPRHDGHIRRLAVGQTLAAPVSPEFGGCFVNVLVTGSHLGSVPPTQCR